MEERSASQTGRRRRQRPRQGISVPWVLAAGIGMIALMPYVLGDFLIDLEVLFEQQVFRLFLLLPCLGFILFAGLRSNYPLAAFSGVLFLILGVEACQKIRLAPNLPPSLHAPADLRVFTQNVGLAPPEEWADWLAENPVDLVCLQEVYVPHQPQWEELAKQLGYEVMFQMLRPDAGMGEMIWSRYPLTPLAPIAAPSRGGTDRYFARARIDCHGTEIDVFCIHLESFHKTRGASQREFFGSSPFRLQQARFLAEEVQKSPYPVVVAGDFNAPPTYRSVRPLRRLLEDAWVAAGVGLGSSFPSSFPLVRIDAILYRGFVPDRARVAPIRASDHRGVAAVLNLEMPARSGD